MRRNIAIFLAAFMFTGCGAKIVQNEPKPVDDTVYTRESAGIRLEDDFYGYLNFDFLYGTDIPADMMEMGTLRGAQKNIDDIISREIIKLGNCDKTYPKGSSEQLIRDIYEQCLDTDTRDKIGLAPLEKGLNSLKGARTAKELVNVCGMLYTEYGVSVLPAVGVIQDFCDSSRNMPYVGQMQLYYSADELLNGKDTAENLQQQLTELLNAFGHEDADSLAYAIVTMLLDIAECTADLDKMSVEDMYNIRKPEEFAPLLAEYFEMIGMGGRDIMVIDTVQLEKICSLLTDENTEIWKNLAECMLIYAYKDYLPSDYAKAFEQNEHKTAEERAVQTAESLLMGDVENIYVQKYRDDKTFAAVREMTVDIISAYRKCIKGSESLTENDRKECLAKIDNITVNIGCSDKEMQREIQISDNLLESAVSIKRGAVQEMLTSVDKAPKVDEWNMPAYAVNAYYDSQKNSITVPMGTFIVPIFDVKADYYTNLGGLGSIIAHEIGHAFDADGILYDEKGNYRPDRISTERTELLCGKVAEYFGSMQIMGTFYINGENTKGENAADLGGMQVISSMTDDKDELRRIFESYTKLWATLSYDTNVSGQITDDVHSPSEIRVNGVLSSLDQFYRAYDISENDGMYVPYDKRVRVW
ncbi:M13 family metallopeptidase [Ruminococcus flavefaciens]|uniref:Putative endopeptidase n=1 Tax=Ruminococcus flavefaciens TaxID=1265 RepID=A0A1M7I1R6_RUMFL|nr:M13 family metallopeptidase [Ruminococcus flavefaciens]SHM34588.1 putative endopeptidase [Ruminococcus flavefaciens]